jgi:hypothetical protein
LGAALIGWEGDIQLSLGRQTPRVRVVGWGYMGIMGGQKCRSSGGWWLAGSWWWRGMADLPGVVAGVAVILTVVPSLGRGMRRKWPNLVVIWQLGVGGGGVG